MNIEKNFYEKTADWDFSMINYTEENLTNWDLYQELKNSSNLDSTILDLGTGGGEKVLHNFPKVKKIVGTDFSSNMIETAKNNLQKSGKSYIEFKVMDNLNMDTPDDYFDIVVARHTVISAKQIYKTLKKGGKLLLRGVDKLDCWQLKLLFQKGQAFNDPKPISLIDYENIISAGFKKVELIPIHIREYYKTKEDLLALLLKTPILSDFSEIEKNSESVDEIINIYLLDKYIEENMTDKGILLIRRYYGITAVKE